MTEKTVEWYQKELADRFAYFYYQTDGTFNFPNSAEGDLLKMTQKMLNLMKADHQPDLNIKNNNKNPTPWSQIMSDHQPTFEVGEYYRVCGTTRLTYKVTPNDILEKQETKFYVDHEDRFVKMHLRKEAIERDAPATAEQIATFKRAEHFASKGREWSEFKKGDIVQNTKTMQLGLVESVDEDGDALVNYNIDKPLIYPSCYKCTGALFLTLIQTAEELKGDQL